MRGGASLSAHSVAIVPVTQVVPGQYLGCWEFKHLDRPLTDDEFATAVGVSMARPAVV